MLHHDGRPRGPVIGSLTSANAEFNRWLSQNSHSQLPDALGLYWTLTPEVRIMPDPVNLHAAVHRLSYDLKTQIGGQILVEKGVLDASKDQRLLSLLDDTLITFLYQRPAFETDKAEKIRAQIEIDLIKIRKSMKALDLSDLFRSKVGRFINSRFLMTYPPITSPQIKIDLEV